MGYHLVKGKTGYRVEEGADRTELKTRLKEGREALVHSFGPSMTREVAESKASALNASLEKGEQEERAAPATKKSTKGKGE